MAHPVECPAHLNDCCAPPPVISICYWVHGGWGGQRAGSCTCRSLTANLMPNRLLPTGRYATAPNPLGAAVTHRLYSTWRWEQ